MSNYRAAKCIELHDSNVALTTYDESYSFTALTGRTEYAEKRAFTIRYCDIRMLATMFGMNTESKIPLSEMSEQTFIGGKQADCESIEFPIYKFHHDYSDSKSGSGEKIVKLECEIISDRLINIRTTSTNDDSENPYTEEITYCGAFTTWWAKP